MILLGLKREPSVGVWLRSFQYQFGIFFFVIIALVDGRFKVDNKSLIICIFWGRNNKRFGALVNKKNRSVLNYLTEII